MNDLPSAEEKDFAAFFVVLRSWGRKICLNHWFSHDVTKIQNKKLSIPPTFYFHDALEQLKTNFHTNFRFNRVRLNF